MLTTAGAIGDIHCEDEALARALAFLVARDVDRILAVGDLADGPGDLALDAKDALQELLAVGEHAFAIAGHPHRRMVRTIAGMTIIDAGTLARRENPCIVVVGFAARVAEFFDVTEDGLRPAEREVLP